MCQVYSLLSTLLHYCNMSATSKQHQTSILLVRLSPKLFGQHLAAKECVVQCLSNNASNYNWDKLSDHNGGWFFSALRCFSSLKTASLCEFLFLFFLVSWMAFSAGQNLVTFIQQCGFGTGGCFDDHNQLSYRLARLVTGTEMRKNSNHFFHLVCILIISVWCVDVYGGCCK